MVKAPKTGIYQIRGTVLGQSVRESTFTTDLEVAEGIRLKTEQEMRARKLHGPQAVVTFSEAAEDYRNHGGKDGQGGTLNIKALVAHFGNTLLSEIDQLAIQKFAREKYPKCGAASVARLVYTPMITIMRLAAVNKKCSLPMFKRPKIIKKMVVHAPDAWVNDFLLNCTRKRLKAAVWLLTTTGCRVGELVRIRWEHVSLDRKTALIEKTKNGDPRSLPLVDDLVQLLAELKSEGDGIGRVFGYSNRWLVNQAIHGECKRRGITYYSSHKLGRHAIATRMLEAGHTCKEVADAVGWKKVALVAETYGHLEKSKVQALMLGVSRGIGRPDPQK